METASTLERVPTYEVENQVSEPEAYTTEILNSKEIEILTWGDSLTDLVSANAHVIVRCPWAGEVTLSEAMNTYNWPPNMTKEDEPFIISVVLDLLAKEVGEEEPENQEEEEPGQEEQDESPQEDRPEETDKQERKKPAQDGEAVQKSVTKTLDQRPQDSNTVDSETLSKSEVEQSKNIESSDIKAEKFSVPAENIVPVAEKRSGRERAVDKISLDYATAQSEVEPALKETRLDIKPKVEAKQKAATFEVPEANAPTEITVKEPPPDTSPSLGDERTEAFSLSAEIVEKSEPTKPPVLIFESLNTFESIKTADEELDTAEDWQALDYFEAASLDSDGQYALSDTPIKMEEAAIYDLNYESNPSDQVATTSLEEFVPDSLSIEQIEDSLNELAERVDTCEPETIEAIGKTLDKIIELPLKLENHEGANIVTKVEVQEEFEKLFTKLFDTVGMGYTSELIEALAHLTFKHQLVDDIKKLSNERQADEAPLKSGTHEIIQNLLVSLNTIKKTMANAGTIGKFALQLYSFKSEPSSLPA